MAIKQMKIGTRASQLGLWQANWVKSGLEKKLPEMEVTLTKIKTIGDKILDVPLAQVRTVTLGNEQPDESAEYGRDEDRAA